MTELDPISLRAQLDRMVASRVFAQAGRAFPLLEYLVGAQVSGHSGPVDQRTIAIDVLGRDEQFDPTCDAIVRVEIGRLRNKLREYYATEGGADPVIIEVPRGKYRAKIRPRAGGGYTYPESVPHQEICRCQTPDGVSLAYSTIGSGYPLVMLPHWLSHLDADLKNPLVQHYWVELSRRFRLVRYDTRGFGLSDRDVEDFAFDALVTDLETVVDTLGLEQFALLGPSGGALTGAAYAARHPSRVSHFMLLGGFVRGPRRIGYKERSFAEMMQLMIRVGWAQPHSRFRSFFCSMLVPDATPEQHKWMDDAQIAAATPESAERFFVLQSNCDLTPELPNIRARTLVFHGTGETSVPFSEAQYSATRIPGARLVPLPTQNHLLMPDEVAWPLFLREIEAFVARNANH